MNIRFIAIFMSYSTTGQPNVIYSMRLPRSGGLNSVIFNT
jgi:hypothetical protein